MLKLDEQKALTLYHSYTPTLANSHIFTCIQFGCLSFIIIFWFISSLCVFFFSCFNCRMHLYFIFYFQMMYSFFFFIHIIIFWSYIECGIVAKFAIWIDYRNMMNINISNVQRLRWQKSINSSIYSYYWDNFV